MPMASPMRSIASRTPAGVPAIPLDTTVEDLCDWEASSGSACRLKSGTGWPGWGRLTVR